MCGLSVLPAKLLASPQASAWLNLSTPVFAMQNPEVPYSQLPTSFINRGNIDCTNLSFTKRNGTIIPPLFYTESHITDCFFDTTIGEVLGNGYISVPGTPYVAEAVHPDHSPYPIIAFPGSDVFVSNQSGTPAVGNYVWLSHLQGVVHFEGSFTGRIYAEINPVTQSPIADAAGNKLPVLLDNFASSSDGKWAAVDSPGHGIIRINLETMEVVPFADSLENDNGAGSAERIAISGDGRYIAVASKAYNFFRIYDLSTCGAVPNIITKSVSCQSRDVDTFFRSQVADFGSVLQMRFVTNDQLKIYTSYDISTSYKIGQFALAAPGTALVGMEYLGMGDSFSSGEGSQNYEVGTDDPNNKCHLSKLSYPYLIAQKLSFNSFHSVACSGAVTFNVIGGSGFTKNSSVKDRENQYDKNPDQNSLGLWIPGYSKQTKFVAENQPRLITLSVIGNDLGFSAIAKSCAYPGTCYPTYEDRLEVFNDVDSKLDTLTNLFKKLKATAPYGARIYAVGYPQIALSTGQCGLNVHLNESELTFTGMLIYRIDQLVKNAAARAEIAYADIEDAFFGHRLCEASSSDIAVNGITAGNDILGVIGNESLHPNAYGQFLLAQKILGITNNLGVIAPQPATTLAPITANNPALASLPKTGRSLNKLKSFKSSNTLLTNGQPITATLSGFTYALKPNTTYNATINNTPTGTITSDTYGNLSLVVPTTQPGDKKVDIYGPDVTGQPTDLSATVTVIDPNSTQSCSPLANSDKDTDKDGIDDACDPFISPAPVSPPTPTPPTQSSTVPIVIGTNVTTPPQSINIAATATTADSSAFSALQTSVQLPQQVPKVRQQISPNVAPQSTAGKVLSAATTNLQAATISTNQSLHSTAAAHPISFLLITLLTLLFVIILALLRYKQTHNSISSAHSHFSYI